MPGSSGARAKTGEAIAEILSIPRQKCAASHKFITDQMNRPVEFVDATAALVAKSGRTIKTDKAASGRENNRQ
jgi:hypothetical protein